MRHLKIPGRKIGEKYHIPILNGRLCLTNPDTIYPMVYGKICDGIARPTSDDPEFQPYPDTDKDGRDAAGFPIKHEQQPNLNVMLRRILKKPLYIRGRVEKN